MGLHAAVVASPKPTTASPPCAFPLLSLTAGTASCSALQAVLLYGLPDQQLASVHLGPAIFRGLEPPSFVMQSVHIKDAVALLLSMASSHPFCLSTTFLLFCASQAVLLCGLSDQQLASVHLGPAHSGGLHLSRALQFVTLRSAGRGAELSPLGGPWDPALDGGAPAR
jgi:hypothetical protein